MTQQQRTAPTETRTYGYQDWEYYLASASGPWSGSPLGWLDDKIGNRTRETGRGSPIQEYSYLPNSGSTGNTALLSNLRVPFDPPFRSYNWDSGGYLLSIQSDVNEIDYTFDEAGQLASIVRDTESLTNSYDGRGFLSQAVDGGSGGYVNPTSEAEVAKATRLQKLGWSRRSGI